MSSLARIVALMEAAVAEIAGLRADLVGARRERPRGYGPADILTISEAAFMCRVGREDFRAWSLAQGLHRTVAGRGPYVVAGEVVAAMERVEVPGRVVRMAGGRRAAPGLGGLPRS